MPKTKNDTFFLGLSPDPEVTEEKTLWCMPFSWETREKGKHHRSGEEGIHHRASDPEKEKRRVPTVVVYTFFPLLILDFQELERHLACVANSGPQAELRGTRAELSRELRWAKSPIAQSLVFSKRGQLSQAFRNSTWNEHYTNERPSRDSNRSATNAGPLITAGFLYRAGAETPLNFRENFRVSPRMILENFSAVDTQTAVLVSTAEVWISAPDTQTPSFLGFLGIHS